MFHCAAVVCGELLGVGVVAVVVGAQGGVPDGPIVGVVVDGAVRKVDVGDAVAVGPVDGVVGMRAVGRVGDRLQGTSVFIQGVIGSTLRTLRPSAYFSTVSYVKASPLSCWLYQIA